MNSDFKQQAEDIYQLVLELKERDKKLRVFGADGHEYKINPSLSEQEVAAFEKKHGISLPEDYRYFITHIFGSGAGPDYGLIPLKDSLYGTANPAAPFVYQTDIPETIATRFEGAVKGNYDGMITLCDSGCGGYCLLVVQDEHFGQVWTAWDGLFWYKYPSFNQWMLNWVSGELKWLRNENKTVKIRVGMSLEEVKSLTDETWEVRHSAFFNELVAHSPLYGVRLILYEDNQIIKIEER